jgi:integrase/recombinase XerD
MRRTKQANIPTKVELEGLLALSKQGGRHGLRNWAMLHMSYYAGLRAKEISMLNIEDLFKGTELKTSTFLDESQTKGSQPRRITLVDEKLRSAITTYFFKCKSDVSVKLTSPLFTNQSGARFTANGVVKLFEKLYKNAELECSSHSGRRYFATKLGNTPGITTKQMMALGGWSQANIAMQYVETNDEQLDELVGRATL